MNRCDEEHEVSDGVRKSEGLVSTLDERGVKLVLIALLMLLLALLERTSGSGVASCSVLASGSLSSVADLPSGCVEGSLTSSGSWKGYVR